MTRSQQPVPRGLLLFLPLLLLIGCNGEEAPSATHLATAAAPERAPLRVIMPRHPQGLDYLPRSGVPKTEEYRLLERYAASAGRQIEPVRIDEYDQLIPTLLAGQGDIIVNNLTVTPERKAQVNFTAPIAFVHEQLIGRPGETPASAQELGGRQIAVHRTDAYLGTLQRLLQRPYQPPFEIVTVDEGLSADALINAVAEGRYDLTVGDSNLLDALLGIRHDLELGFDISPVRPIAWAVHPDNDTLLQEVNNFLGQHHLAQREETRFQGDLGEMKQRKVLRVLTRNGAGSYFLWRGELLGFEYELAKRFAEQQGLRLEMVVPPSRDLLIPWLKEGRGDFIAAAITIDDGGETNGVRFTRPYNSVSELVVSRSGDDALNAPEDLAGRTVVVRRSSACWQSLEALQQRGIGLALVAAPEQMESEELIALVADGTIDLTVADSHLLDIELTWRDDIQAAFPLDAPRPHGWVVRADNPALLQALNTFIKKEYRSLFYNVTYQKYFRDTKHILSHVGERTDAGDSDLSPYDTLVRRYADRYGFDWRLIVSQMYQESRFDPDARSWVGAIGLLQVMPRTAQEFGFKNLRAPEQGLHAGIKYLDWLQRRFEPELDIGERTWFALAAYNAGIGHVRDARRLARQKGWDPNRWFDNVEKAMVLLAKKEYAMRAKHGYVRGHEPVNYVRQIRDRYLAYVKLKDEGTLVAQDG